jgi:peptidyl-prolyl cis-trans isomerase B (cyclophilin B)
MTVAGDPFRQVRADPPSPPNGPATHTHLQRPPPWPFVPPGGNPYPPTERPHNTLATLSPVFAVVAPPVGVILGHWALIQIHRSGERGRTAAIWGVIIGYVLTVALLAGLILWALTDPSGGSEPLRGPGTVAAEPPLRVPPPVVVTSVAPPPISPRVKLDLAKVTVGTCAEIQKRDIGADALDLFGVPCKHRQGVYTVVARVATNFDCQSTYVAAPPDHSFALCLNEY